MSPPKTKRRLLSSAISLLVTITIVLLAFLYRQQVIDTVRYYQYDPTSAIEAISDKARLTDTAEFTFYASHPAVESSDAFNQHCQRKEADSPILGCYSGGKIYIFDVTDERLDGIKVVTAAHELLHAVYERLDQGDKDRLSKLLQAEYDKVADDDLKKRMEYYEKTEPGESMNELHSIIGTEYGPISDELEEHYKKYFGDRSALVTLHTKVDTVFDSLSEEADGLVSSIESLAHTINTSTNQYNENIRKLNISVATFNSRAQASGGFTTQSEFEAARNELLLESARLNSLRQSIESNITRYKTLLARLDAINAESASLSQSLDSTLADVPTV